MKRFLVYIATMLLNSTSLFASYGQGNPRLEKLYATFMSPCCWEQNLTAHDSQIARELRVRIEAMVSEGRSDEEIKAAFVQQYSKRILALPEGAERNWLFLTPWLAAGTGLAALLLFLRRMRPDIAGPHLEAPTLKGPALAELESEWDQD